MRKLNQPKALNNGKSLPRSESYLNGRFAARQPPSQRIAIGSIDQHDALHTAKKQRKKIFFFVPEERSRERINVPEHVFFENVPDL
jgi:hypothetical protein